MKSRNLYTIFNPFFPMLLLVSVLLSVTGYGKTSKQNRISWKKIEGAVLYEVQVVDSAEKYVLKEKIKTTYIDIILPVGEYRLRLGVINKFNKISQWSTWKKFKIAKKEIPVKKEEPEIMTASVPPWGIKLRIGTAFSQPVIDINDYNYSYRSSILMLGYNFLYIDFIRYVKMAGVELESSQVSYQGKTNGNIRINSINNFFFGSNLYIISNFDLPFNIIFRFGGGIVQSRQDYAEIKGVDLTGNQITVSILNKSFDPYYKAGGSIEFGFSQLFYLEAGADYYTIKYVNRDFASMRYFLLFGVRI